MNVTLLHPGDQGCFASFGAHPRFEVALERALTELLQGRALDALKDFPAPSCDMDEITDALNMEIHFVDSSGVISWEFLRDTPDFEFVDWNFGTTTEEDYRWCYGTIHASGHDIYIADFTHLDVYACRIFVPGMSEIYPIEELQWQNNTVGNWVREPLLRLQDLNEGECAELLDTLNDLDLADSLAITTLIGLAADANSAWAKLRLGELKTLLAIAIGDDEAVLEGCSWIAQLGDLNEARARVYRCIAHLIRIEEMSQDESTQPYAANLELLYGAETLQQAVRLLNGEEQFFGLCNLGANMEGSNMHQRLLDAYRKVWKIA
jgi:ribosomal protein S12 methylthiotransferase accessory factor